MSKLNVENSRNSVGRPPVSPGNKRNSGLDSSTINAMFPDAAAAIAQKKAEYAQQTGNAAPSTRNSAAFGDRTSLVTPTISAPSDIGGKDNMSWRQQDQQPPISRPKSSSGQQQQQPPPMGQFTQPPPSAGLRSPRPQPLPPSNIQNTTLNAPDHHLGDLPALSPYNVGNSSWASMSNTPMVPNFNQAASQSDMIANATAMKLAALSTVNNRIALDDVRKYRRARSNEPQPQNQPSLSSAMTNTGIPGANMVVVNDAGQILNAQQIAALQQQQLAAAAGRRSRPNSPGLAMQGNPLGQVNFASPQNNGFLTAYDGSQPMLNAGLTGLMPQMGHFGTGSHEGYLSDHSEIVRGRSPRGRRGSSKPPEDPTDPSLLQDIPSWLRTLRLHKYTDNLKDLKWDELVKLDEKGLEARGVNALGARNKMLKVRRQPDDSTDLADQICRYLNKFEKLKRKASSENDVRLTAVQATCLRSHRRGPQSAGFASLLCARLISILVRKGAGLLISLATDSHISLSYHDFEDIHVEICNLPHFVAVIWRIT
jgi:hypothetical protein